MASLAELQPNEKAVITEVRAEGELKQRLFSFGMRKGSTITVKAISLTKSTIEVQVEGGMMIALRFEEAKEIEVTYIWNS